MAQAWRWEPACEHILGGRSQGRQRWVLLPQAGQTQTQQATEKGALGEDR